MLDFGLRTYSIDCYRKKKKGLLPSCLSLPKGLRRKSLIIVLKLGRYVILDSNKGTDLQSFLGYGWGGEGGTWGPY